MKTLLLTGISGSLGWNIAQFPQNQWRIVGTHYQHANGVPPNVESHALNLLDIQAITTLFDALKPDAVVHTAAVTSTNYCEKYPKKTYPVNVTASLHLAKLCAKTGIPYLFTSSSQVFDGLHPVYYETDTPNPLNQYGQQKWAAEKGIQQIYPDATICRIPVLFGWHSPVAQSFFVNWYKAMQTGQLIQAFDDEYRPFLSYKAAIEGLFLLLNRRESGLYHFSGGELMNRYNFALQMKTILQLPNAIVTKTQQKNVKMAAYRPPVLNLNHEKLQQLGYIPRTVSWELKRLTPILINTPNIPIVTKPFAA